MYTICLCVHSTDVWKLYNDATSIIVFCVNGVYMAQMTTVHTDTITYVPYIRICMYIQCSVVL